MDTMPQPYPKEFRDDVIRVVQTRDSKTTIAQIAKDFGVHEGTINKWLRQADIDAGNKPGNTSDESAELREMRRRRLHRQRNPVEIKPVIPESQLPGLFDWQNAVLEHQADTFETSTLVVIAGRVYGLSERGGNIHNRLEARDKWRWETSAETFHSPVWCSTQRG